jgi:hypothetical protein
VAHVDGDSTGGQGLQVVSKTGYHWLRSNLFRFISSAFRSGCFDLQGVIPVGRFFSIAHPRVLRLRSHRSILWLPWVSGRFEFILHHAADPIVSTTTTTIPRCRQPLFFTDSILFGTDLDWGTTSTLFGSAV